MKTIAKSLTMILYSVFPYLCCASGAPAQTWQGPLAVSVVWPPDATRSCAFFQLKGAPQANPAFPGVPWFAIPMSNVGFHEQYALLLSVALNNHPISVATSGQAACGYAQVVYMQSNFP